MCDRSQEKAPSLKFYYGFINFRWLIRSNSPMLSQFNNNCREATDAIEGLQAFLAFPFREMRDPHTSTAPLQSITMPIEWQ
jgi:hypothetical protein